MCCTHPGMSLLLIPKAWVTAFQCFLNLESLSWIKICDVPWHRIHLDSSNSFTSFVVALVFVGSRMICSENWSTFLINESMQSARVVCKGTTWPPSILFTCDSISHNWLIHTAAVRFRQFHLTSSYKDEPWSRNVIDQLSCALIQGNRKSEMLGSRNEAPTQGFQEWPRSSASVKTGTLNISSKSVKKCHQIGGCPIL